MKTKDSISKKKQKLRHLALYWDARATDTLSEIALTEEAQVDKKARATFCRQEAAKRRKELDALQTRTRWQVLNGWK